MAVVYQTVKADVDAFPINAGVDVFVAHDIEIVIFGAFDEATDEAVEAARKAAERLLRDYGVQAVVEPRTVYWGHTTGFTLVAGEELPIVTVNGFEVARGRAPSAAELIDAALEVLGARSEEAAPPLVYRRWGDKAETAAVTEG